MAPALPATGRGKSADAFRTISEVATELEGPQHVLRFWESKFPQVRPLKRAGGRRYYRPDDVALLRRIRQCLYEQGYTIKGVQKLLREGALKTDDIPRLTLPTT
ncbi:MAG: MerR family transcriptional regulator, partial [Stellaceae bacterium]